MRVLRGAWRRVALGLLALGAAAWSGTVEGASGSVEDRLAIAEQVAQYSYRWDGKDAEGFGDLFNTWRKTDRGWKIAERVLFGDRFTGP